MSFGTPQYKNNNQYTRYMTAQEDKPVIGRIIPPINKLAADGIWNVYHACHWGYRVPVGTDPGKTKFELFECIRIKDWKNKIIKVECPECAKNDQVQSERDELEIMYKKQNKSESDIKEILGPKNGYLKTHTCEGKQYVNFKLETGEIVVLLIPNTLFRDQLKPLIEEISTKYGFDALLEGVIFEFSSTGKGILGANKKVDKVRYATTIGEFVGQDGKTHKNETIKTMPWTSAEVEEAEIKGIDLYNPDRFVRINAEQIQMLVDGSGEPDYNAEVFSFANKRVRGERSAPPPPPARTPVAATAPPVVKVPEAVKVPEPVKPAPFIEDDDEESIALRALAVIRAKKEAAKAAATAPIKTAGEITVNLANGGEGLSDEEFMRQINSMGPAV